MAGFFFAACTAVKKITAVFFRKNTAVAKIKTVFKKIKTAVAKTMCFALWNEEKKRDFSFAFHSLNRTFAAGNIL